MHPVTRTLLSRAALGLVAWGAMPACDSRDDVLTAPAVIDAPVVYGIDNRVEVYEATLAQQASAASTVALLDASKLTASGGNYLIDGSVSLGQKLSLCSTERFVDQPSSAFCSGFLVGPDLIATAGHCITTAAECSSVRFVFDFKMLTATTANLTVPADNVYECQRIVERVQDNAGADYAIIQLKRSVVNRTPLATRTSGSVTLGQSLYVIGHPSGIPTKVAAGAQVKGNSAAGYFSSNLDTFAGNSGSAVFGATTGLVEGILVRGSTDYKRNKGCYLTNFCSDSSGCSGGFEEVTRATAFAHLMSPASCVDASTCEDHNPCTDNACTAGFCAFTSNTALCNDGDPCTTPDQCSGSTCMSGPDTCPAPVCGGNGASCQLATDCCASKCISNKCKG